MRIIPLIRADFNEINLDQSLTYSGCWLFGWRLGWTFEPPRDCYIKYDKCAPVALFKIKTEPDEEDERFEIYRKVRIQHGSSKLVLLQTPDGHGLGQTFKSYYDKILISDLYLNFVI